jgi:hypothetical protein
MIEEADIRIETKESDDSDDDKLPCTQTRVKRKVTAPVQDGVAISDSVVSISISTSYRETLVVNIKSEDSS